MASRSGSAIMKGGSMALARPIAKDIRNIVVPLDGSRTAEHALPYAIASAPSAGASVRLVHVFSLLESFGSWEQSYYRSATEHYRRQKHAYLNGLVHRVRPHLGEFVTGVVIDDLDIASALGTQTDTETLVIMATHSRSFVKKLLKGSVADALIRKLEGPLLLVRGSSSVPDLASDPMPRRILIPLDGTVCAERSIIPAMQLGALSGAQYTLLHLRDAGRMVNRTELSAAGAYLKDVANRSTTPLIELRCGSRD